MLIVEQDMVRVSEIKKEVQVYSIPATRIAEELGKHHGFELWAMSGVLHRRHSTSGGQSTVGAAVADLCSAELS